VAEILVGQLSCVLQPHSSGLQHKLRPRPHCRTGSAGSESFTVIGWLPGPAGLGKRAFGASDSLARASD
jgi:hypothetical protein